MWSLSFMLKATFEPQLIAKGFCYLLDVSLMEAWAFLPICRKKLVNNPENR